MLYNTKFTVKPEINLEPAAVFTSGWVLHPRADVTNVIGGLQDFDMPVVHHEPFGQMENFVPNQCN